MAQYSPPPNYASDMRYLGHGVYTWTGHDSDGNPVPQFWDAVAGAQLNQQGADAAIAANPAIDESAINPNATGGSGGGGTSTAGPNNNGGGQYGPGVGVQPFTGQGFQNQMLVGGPYWSLGAQANDARGLGQNTPIGGLLGRYAALQAMNPNSYHGGQNYVGGLLGNQGNGSAGGGGAGGGGAGGNAGGGSGLNLNPQSGIGAFNAAHPTPTLNLGGSTGGISLNPQSGIGGIGNGPNLNLTGGGQGGGGNTTQPNMHQLSAQQSEQPTAQPQPQGFQYANPQSPAPGGLLAQAQQYAGDPTALAHFGALAGNQSLLMDPSFQNMLGGADWRTNYNNLMGNNGTGATWWMSHPFTQGANGQWTAQGWTPATGGTHGAA